MACLAGLARDEEALREEDFGTAESLIQGVAAWALDERRVEALELELQELQESVLAPVRKLALPTPIPNVEAARAKLHKSLRGRIHLFEGGGMLVNYREGRDLLANLELLKGKKKSLGLSAGERGRQSVRIRALGTRTILQIKVPLFRLLDVSLKVVANAKVPETAHVALLVAARPGRLDSRGLSRGTVPVEMSEGGRLQTLLTMGVPRLEVKKPVKLTLAIEGRGFAATFTGGLQSKRGRQSLRRPQRLGRRAASVILYVSDADVRIDGLRIRGLVAPRAIK